MILKNFLSIVFILADMKASDLKILIKSEKGQVIVEYVLLLLISTAIALTLIALTEVGPGADNRPVFKYWEHLLKEIGEDIST